MKVKWLGHASFLITSEQGTKIITDPYTPTSERLLYDPINEAAHIVTVSHNHSDHNNIASVRGNPQVVKGSGIQTVKGIEFKSIPTYHDPTSGSQRGPNTIFCFTVDGIRVCHLGDLGHPLSDEQIAKIGPVDILLTPVAGTYTIDAAEATELSNKVKPWVLIPMHFKNDKCLYPISQVDAFLKGKTNVRMVKVDELEFRRDQLPPATEIIVLEHAL